MNTYTNKIRVQFEKVEPPKLEFVKGLSTPYREWKDNELPYKFVKDEK